tara:strand:- start:5615 stop:5872 length:258 start_codon:yes stop_codon:yes gene_type:complete
MKSLNLYYIRAAIEAHTGRRLSFPTIRRLLVEENLITEQELSANPMAHKFRGYGAYFFSEENSVEIPKNPERFLPDCIIEEDFDE